MLMRIAALLFIALLCACAKDNGNSAPKPKPVSSTLEAGYQPGDSNVVSTAFQDTRWKAILIAGDNSIANFDRAIDGLDRLLAGQGIEKRAMLSATESEWQKGKAAAIPREIDKAFQNLDLKPGDGCFLFMTSHGTRDGFYLAQKSGNHIWTHRQFADTFNKYCGDLPSIAIISACYSGGFIDEGILRPNLILLTAARRDRTSFGCGAEYEYTYYDDCLLSSWPKSRSWEGLAGTVSVCVAEKERRIGSTPSLPQIFLGRQMKGLLLP